MNLMIMEILLLSQFFMVQYLMLEKANVLHNLCLTKYHLRPSIQSIQLLKLVRTAAVASVLPGRSNWVD